MTAEKPKIRKYKVICLADEGTSSEKRKTSFAIIMDTESGACEIYEDGVRKDQIETLGTAQPEVAKYVQLVREDPEVVRGSPSVSQGCSELEDGRAMILNDTLVPGKYNVGRISRKNCYVAWGTYHKIVEDAIRTAMNEAGLITEQPEGAGQIQEQPEEAAPQRNMPKNAKKVYDRYGNPTEVDEGMKKNTIWAKAGTTRRLYKLGDKSHAKTMSDEQAAEAERINKEREARKEEMIRELEALEAKERKKLEEFQGGAKQ